MRITKENSLLLFLLGIHIVLGAAAAVNSALAKLLGLLPLLLGTWLIVRSQNRNNEAVYCAAYYASLEVLLRVTGGTLGYEMSKYATVFFLLLGQYFSPQEQRRNIWLIFIFLLGFGLFFTDWSDSSVTQLVRATLSGPVLLAVSAYCFTGRRIDQPDHTKFLRIIILPLFALAVALTVRTPDLSLIDFRSASNFATSGGFGPVHVSSVLGIGVLLIIAGFFLNHPIFGYRWIDFSILAFLLYRSLLTFSRSGIYAAAIVVLLMLITMIVEQSIRIQSGKFIITSIALFIILLATWNQVNNVTRGMAYNRYSGRNTEGARLEDISSNRMLLMEQELEMFSKHPLLGIGVGMTSVVRRQEFHFVASSHTEYTRLLAEHGFFGVIMLVILIWMPVRQFLRTSGISRIYLTILSAYALIIMFPASTRTALPLLLYGFSFVLINQEENN